MELNPYWLVRCEIKFEDGPYRTFKKLFKAKTEQAARKAAERKLPATGRILEVVEMGYRKPLNY